MDYKIEVIEGIGQFYAEKLIAVGIKTTDDLPDRCATPKDRKEVAEVEDMIEQAKTLDPRMVY